MSLTNENEITIWLDQSPSSSTVSTPTTQIASPLKNTFNAVCVENNLTQLTQEDKPIQSLNTNDALIKQCEDNIKSEVNLNTEINNDNLFLKSNNIAVTTTVYP